MHVSGDRAALHGRCLRLSAPDARSVRGKASGEDVAAVTEIGADGRAQSGRRGLPADEAVDGRARSDAESIAVHRVRLAQPNPAPRDGNKIGLASEPALGRDELRGRLCTEGFESALTARNLLKFAPWTHSKSPQRTLDAEPVSRVAAIR